ncbi:MAG: hypothetical protein Nkreftii_001667 [Candidatus Nitrospira kreftii]|uniref:Uncharacterized protein n=1 Tax=Candidatus Nitrospira kreftii TaxID=2652173 RepID=A0A7S8FDJ7_9BACT|nr:MAG: hypothetical protein Nkreftii_001667 [Candidatus Nitrospira kreftii]
MTNDPFRGLERNLSLNVALDRAPSRKPLHLVHLSPCSGRACSYHTPSTITQSRIQAHGCPRPQQFSFLQTGPTIYRKDPYSKQHSTSRQISRICPLDLVFILQEIQRIRLSGNGTWSIESSFRHQCIQIDSVSNSIHQSNLEAYAEETHEPWGQSAHQWLLGTHGRRSLRNTISQDGNWLGADGAEIAVE